MDVRIENLVTKLELHEMDLLWGYLGVALRLWLLVFDGLSIKMCIRDRSTTIPAAQFTAEGGYYYNFLSDAKKVVFFYAGYNLLFQKSSN